MPDYGVTDNGFELKRLDTIMEEVHQDLTDGFGFDTRLQETSFLNVLVTTFCSQIAELWETAQDSYYAKYPSTATGLNLDNAVQYGGITRIPKRRSCYPLHCTGDDGTVVRKGTVVATNSKPEVRLFAAEEFEISRSSFNKVSIKVPVPEEKTVYSIVINGEQYSYSSMSANAEEILNGLKETVTNDEYRTEVCVDGNEKVLRIEDTVLVRRNALVLSDNLTTEEVTSIVNFFTDDYGRITLPNGIVSKMVNNITGFNAVTNLIEPVYGRLDETDTELRQSYANKSSLRSNTMIDSIVAELLSNVPNVESASGYENDTDLTNDYGLPPHSIEIVVEGGENSEIAEAILRKKAGGIQTHGSICVDVPGRYGDSIPIRFNRPEYLYTWLRIVLHGRKNELPVNYAALVQDSVMSVGMMIVAGDDLLTQMLNEGIYSTVAGVTYIDIMAAASSDKAYTPKKEDYTERNVSVTQRQKILLDATRIEVVLDADS